MTSTDFSSVAVIGPDDDRHLQSIEARDPGAADPVSR
jgi:hypothetical protein